MRKNHFISTEPGQPMADPGFVAHSLMSDRHQIRSRLEELIDAIEYVAIKKGGEALAGLDELHEKIEDIHDRFASMVDEVVEVLAKIEEEEISDDED